MTLDQEHAPLDVIWHDLECGGYSADLELWRGLAAAYGDPVLDVGAGAGRVALDLARRGHRVIALDRDPRLLTELRRRAGDLPVRTVVADARDFELAERFPLIIAPMQTIQLLSGSDGRRRFLAAGTRHLRPGGVLAVAITESLECFSLDEGYAPPAPDMRELGDVVYSSQPIAIRKERHGFVLERVRETIGPEGERSAEPDVVHLDGLTAPELEHEAVTAGLRRLGRRDIAATTDHVGSIVVMLGG